MIRFLTTIVLAAAASISASQCFAQATAKKVAAEYSWPQFLGASRNGISAETGLLKEWPADRPKEVWRVRGGVGMSGLAIADGQLVTLVQRDGSSCLWRMTQRQASHAGKRRSRRNTKTRWATAHGPHRQLRPERFWHSLVKAFSQQSTPLMVSRSGR